MSQSRLRLLAVLAALAAAVIAVASWSGRPLTITSVTTADQSVRALTSLDAVKQVLASVTDEASATTALPALREESARLLDIRDVAETSLPSVRAALAAKLNPLLPDLDARISATLKGPAVEPIVGPVLRQIAERAKALAKG